MKSRRKLIGTLNVMSKISLFGGIINLILNLLSISLSSIIVGFNYLWVSLVIWVILRSLAEILELLDKDSQRSVNPDYNPSNEWYESYVICQ